MGASRTTALRALHLAGPFLDLPLAAQTVSPLAMFRGLTKDLTGSADICATATRPDKLQALAYLLPGEALLFAFQSAKEEFAFTNEALLLVTGENATTTRKLVERLDYRDNLLTDVAFETTGRVDRDCEIKFRIGERDVSIDIARREEEAVKAYYKTLLLLAREQEERRRRWSHAIHGVDKAADALKLNGVKDLVALSQDTTQWLDATFARERPRCYREVIAGALPTKPLMK